MPTAESPQPIRAHLNTRSGHHSARTLLTEVPTDGGVPTAPRWRNELAPDFAVQVDAFLALVFGGVATVGRGAYRGVPTALISGPRTEAAPVQDG